MTEQSTPGTKCPCGCGGPVLRGRKYALGGRCRQRAYRKRVRAAADAAGVPPTVTLETVDAASRTGARNGDAQTRRNRPPRTPRPGLTVYIADRGAAEAARTFLAAPRRPGLDLVADAIAKAQERRRRRDAKAGGDVPVAARLAPTRAAFPRGGRGQSRPVRGGDVTTGPSTTPAEA